MQHKLPWREDLDKIIVTAEMRRYLSVVDGLPVRHSEANAGARAISAELPVSGTGAPEGCANRSATA